MKGEEEEETVLMALGPHARQLSAPSERVVLQLASPGGHLLSGQRKRFHAL